MGKYDDQKPPQKVYDLLLGRMHRLAVPVYSGTLSLFIGWPLNRTLDMLQELEDKGVVRQLTVDEKRVLKVDSRANMYVLTEPAHPGKAKW